VIPPLGFPLTVRASYAHIGLLAFVIAATWLLRRVLALAFTHARSLVRGTGQASTRSLMLLAQRMIRRCSWYWRSSPSSSCWESSKTALAALGVVGVALALGAQRSRTCSAGSSCSPTRRSPWVTIAPSAVRQASSRRDTALGRLRTANQSLVSLPTRSLAQTGIELATRADGDASPLRLTYATSVDQLKRILGDGRHWRRSPKSALGLSAPHQFWRRAISSNCLPTS
jgi:hypothetical protein